MPSGACSILFFTFLASLVVIEGCGQPRPDVDQATVIVTPSQVDGLHAGASLGDGHAVAVDISQPTCGTSYCPSDAYCELSEDPPACHPHLLSGMPCKDHYQCAPLLFCDTSLEVPQCRKAPGKNGNCEDSGGICAEGFFCDVVHSPAKCRDPKEAGKPCSLDEGCTSGLYCDYQSVKHTCTPKPKPATECDPAAASPCPPGQFCSADHDPALCLPLGKKGQSCVDDSSCREGLACALNPKTGRKICKPVK